MMMRGTPLTTSLTGFSEVKADKEAREVREAEQFANARWVPG
jgi:hypothetical protein